ncbi:MAG: prolipoprotein diacylglyceryl transferase [Verrucomicrobia bacterium]|nr:prolipoprotein diacylglyceryl transferase [Verrucomicrobiota bacterium]
MIGVIFWDPDPVVFRLPGLGHPIVWYGLLFALGFFCGYFVMRRLVEAHLRKTLAVAPQEGFLGAASRYTDQLLWMCVIGTVVGARLSHVFFYEWPYYSQNALEIFKVWKGGLSSHGAACGVALALVFFYLKTRSRYSTISFLNLFDKIIYPAALIAVFIRLGNFINQELVGTPSSLPWAVLFGHPSDGSLPLARHPVQLYEAAAYACILGILVLFRRLKAREGVLFGSFLTLVFGARFWLEIYKAPLTQEISPLSMGQLLSIPLFALGILLVIWSLLREKRARLPHRQES